jgi:hypothetical protein
MHREKESKNQPSSGIFHITFLVRQDKNVCITLFRDICPAPVGRGMKILSGTLVTLILCIMIYQSWQLTCRLAHATTPALRIKESWFGWTMIILNLVFLAAGCLVVHLIKNAGSGGGLVICSVHNIQADVPVDNVLALYDTARKLDRYPLT